MATKRKTRARPKAGARARTAAGASRRGRVVSARGRAAEPRAAKRGRRPAAKTAQNVTPEEAKFLKRYRKALSPTTQRAKWLHAADEHADRPGQSLATRRPEVIKRWAEERKAKPATIGGTRHDGRAGVLRFNFPGFGSGRRIEEINWDDWFRTFEERQLVFLFQEQKRDGSQSNFFRLDSPFRENA